jgi:hypothetical protein
MDRLQLFETSGEKKRRCVACGHEDELGNASSQAPRTRLEGGLKKQETEGPSPVRILDPRKQD